MQRFTFFQSTFSLTFAFVAYALNMPAVEAAEYAVRVEVSEVLALDPRNLEGLGEKFGAEFYLESKIGSNSWKSPRINNQNHIRPAWSHQVTVGDRNALARGMVIDLKLMEQDDGSSDDHVSIASSNRTLQLKLALNRGVPVLLDRKTGRRIATLRGSFRSAFDTGKLSSEGSGKDRARIFYRVRVCQLSTAFRPFEKPSETLRLITYNVHFLPGSVRTVKPSAIKRKDPEYRADEIARQLNHGGYDIIALNEVFDNSHRERLERVLGDAWRSRGKMLRKVGPPDRTLSPEDGGVTIVTHLPILASHELVFDKSSGSDRLSAKGVVHARIALDGSQNSKNCLDVFATHLQAGGGKEDIRKSQVSQIRDFIKRHNNSRYPWVLMGDLNIHGERDHQTNSRSEYHQMMRIMAETGRRVEDLWATVAPRHLQRSGETSNPLQPSGSSRLDYILLGNPTRPSLSLSPLRIEVEHFRNRRVKSLSDHSAVLCRLYVIPNRPRIESTRLTTSVGGRIYLTGLFPTRKGLVDLQEPSSRGSKRHALRIESWTSNRITAQVPDSLQPGPHRLRVFTSSRRTNGSNTVNVNVSGPVDRTTTDRTSNTLVLTRWYDSLKKNRFITVQKADSAFDFYKAERQEGKVFNPATGIRRPSGVVKLYRWYNRTKTDRFVTTDARWSGNPGKMKNGYRLVAIEGYVYPPNYRAKGGLLALHAWDNGRDRFATSDPAWRGRRGAVKNGYRWVRLEGYLAPTITRATGVATKRVGATVNRIGSKQIQVIRKRNHK